LVVGWALPTKPSCRAGLDWRIVTGKGGRRGMEYALFMGTIALAIFFFFCGGRWSADNLMRNEFEAAKKAAERRATT
jgi:hypothetical protein